MEPHTPAPEHDAVPAWPPLPAPSGDGAVDGVLSRLGELSGLPVTEQAAAYQQIHEALAEVLEGETPDGAQAPSRPDSGRPPASMLPGSVRPGPVPGPPRGNA